MENFLWMIAGAIISAWTGIATSRYFAFATELQRAREVIVTMPRIFETMQKSPDQLTATSHAVALLLSPSLALRAQGQLNASSDLAIFSNGAETVLVNCWREMKLGLNQIRFIGATHGIHHPGEAERQALAALADLSLGKVTRFMEKGLALIDGIQPDWFTILFGKTYGIQFAHRYLRVTNAYLDFSEHLETGEQLKEIRVRENARRQKERDEIAAGR